MSFDLTILYAPLKFIFYIDEKDIEKVKMNLRMIKLILENNIKYENSKTITLKTYDLYSLEKSIKNHYNKRRPNNIYVFTNLNKTNFCFGTYYFANTSSDSDIVKYELNSIENYVNSKKILFLGFFDKNSFLGKLPKNVQRIIFNYFKFILNVSEK